MASDDLLPEMVVMVGCEEYASPDSVSLVTLVEKDCSYTFSIYARLSAYSDDDAAEKSIGLTSDETSDMGTGNHSFIGRSRASYSVSVTRSRLSVELFLSTIVTRWPKAS